MKLDFEAYAGVGPFRYGQTREETRALIDSDRRNFKRGRGEPPIDQYVAEGLYLRFDKYDRLAAIECVLPAKLIVADRDLLGTPYGEVGEWLRSEDPELREYMGEMVSYDLGMAVLQREAGPTAFCDSVLCFCEGFFDDDRGLQDPEWVTSFMLQAGFVEGMLYSPGKYINTAVALRECFGQVREAAIVLWNTVPVAFDYPEVMAEILPQLAETLTYVLKEKAGNAQIELDTEHLAFSWELSWGGKLIELNGEWQRVPGGHVDALNAFSRIEMRKSDFLSEWKLPLEQALHVLEGVGLKPRGQAAQQDLRKMQTLVERIEASGRWYAGHSAHLT